MDEDEFKQKYAELRILKSIQEYQKSVDRSQTVVYPIRVPDDLIYQILRLQGPEELDKLIHEIFQVGLSAWSENLFNTAFGSQRRLEEFIELMKKKTRE